MRISVPCLCTATIMPASQSGSCFSSPAVVQTSLPLHVRCSSLQLTPLPRLSFEFQVKAHSRRSLSSRAASFDDCTLYSPGSSSGGARWQPSMSRIRSGHDLELLDGDEGAAAGQQSAVWPAGMSLQDAPTAGEATESLGRGELREGLQQVEQVGLQRQT
jgi:hypothetical protein